MGHKRTLHIALAIGIPAVLLVILIGTVLPVAAGDENKWSQCADGGNGEDPFCESGGNTGWITGKVGGNKATYEIGDFIAYRAYRNDLPIGWRYCSGSWWDIAKAELPAIDYVGTFSYTLENANALHGTNIPKGTPPSETEPIPPDPILQGGFVLNGNPFSGTLPYGPKDVDGSQGVLTFWGAEDVVIKGYALTDATPEKELTDASQSWEVCFTTTFTEVVFAWGGHIADPVEWGAPEKPPGSPYHMKTGTLPDWFTAPRNADNDLVAFPLESSCNDTTDCPAAIHSTVGSQDLQLGFEDSPEEIPTAITLESVSADGGSYTLILALAGVGVVVILSALTLRRRRQGTDVV